MDLIQQHLRLEINELFLGINIFNDDVYEKSEGFNFMIATTSTNAVSSCPPNKGSVTIMDD